jgi:POT family proton-dependent oligopeptide transporter
MSEATLTTELDEIPTTDASGFVGHPKGLGPLFFTELWERFSYYGMRAILVLYMVAPTTQGGLGFDTKHATSIYGTYTMAVYLTALPGGLIADYFLGARLAVLLGGIIITFGHFSMVFHSMTSFYLGMVLIAVGTGFLKPNISAMVGGLYRQNDPRRDSGFSIFYMGINVGAVLAPLVIGYFAQGESFKRFLSSLGFEPTSGWHWGFGAAGVGMILGLTIFVLSRRQLANVGTQVKKRSAAEVKSRVANQPLTRNDWKRIAAILIFFTFTMLFWAAYEQKGASLNLYAKELVRTEAFGMKFPSSYLQSCTPLFVILLAPVFSIIWVRLKERQPSSPAKFTLGLLFIGAAYLLLIPASLMTVQGKISPLWLVGLYFLEVCGEMCLSPVGLSTVTKLAPAKLVGIMMGVWFLATSFGNKLAGRLSGYFVANDAMQLVKLYGGIAVGLLVAAGVLALLTPTIKRLMGEVK